MPRKVARKRRSKHSSKNNSDLSKFLTFPVLAVILFVLLSVVTLFLVVQPNNKVLGTQGSIFSLE